MVDSGQVRDWGCGTNGRTSGIVCGGGGGGLQYSREWVEVWVGAVVNAGEGVFGREGAAGAVQGRVLLACGSV